MVTRLIRNLRALLSLTQTAHINVARIDHMSVFVSLQLFEHFKANF